jgi:hypothetical protein
MLAIVPTATNSTIYGVHLYQTCPFRYGFDELSSHQASSLTDHADLVRFHLFQNLSVWCLEATNQEAVAGKWIKGPRGRLLCPHPNS